MPLLAAATRTSATRRGITTAQALSWAGDLALLRDGDRAFLAGLGAFAGAHLAYVHAFASDGDRLDAPLTPGVRAAAALLVTAAPTMTFAAHRSSPGLAAPVAVYAALLAAMFGTASRLDTALDRTARRQVQAGAALFLVSDTLLATQRFLLHTHVRPLETVVMATYAGGQALIAVGESRLHARGDKQEAGSAAA
jgi:uncharacterized membrane protein YhhN